MNIRDFARFFVRFQAAVFLFYAVVDFSYIGPYYRSFHLIHEYRDMDSAAASNFAAALFRIGIHLLVALVLFVKAEKVIDYFLGGRIQPAPSDIQEKLTTQ